VTSYTDNRRYPYPSSDREASNGALWSEFLARAVAADLDVLGVGWAAEPSKDTIIVGLSADSAAFGTGAPFTVLTNQVNKQVGTWGATPSRAMVGTGQDGWYLAILNTRVDATGTVTVNAKHTAYLRQMRNNSAGITSVYSERRGDTYTPTSTASIYNETGGIFRMLAGDQFWLAYEHTNTGSTVQLKAAHTFLSVTRLADL
jgi:hypothetical protein